MGSSLARGPGTAVAMAFVCLAAVAACSGEDQGRPPTGEPEKVLHLPTFRVPDGYTSEESQETGALELDGRTGCLTWGGHTVVFPRGSALTDDDTITFPDGTMLRWRETSEFFETETTGPPDETLHDLQACLGAQHGPVTLAWVTGVPGPPASS